MNDIALEYPLTLLLILPFILCHILCSNKKTVYYFPHLNLLQKEQSRTLFIIKTIKWIAIIMAIIALSSPYKPLQKASIDKNGLDIILSIDTSGSMAQRGFNPHNPNQTRWEVVSDIIREFIPKRTNDNIGLIVFGTSVMTASPLSFDKQAQSDIIQHLSVGVAGDKTALIDSLASSINLLKNSQATSKIIILLTDGEDTASRIPLTIIEKLIKKYNIKLYTIGIGESNKHLLNRLITFNQGKAFYASSKQMLDAVYEEINQLETSKINNHTIIHKYYLYHYFVFLSLFLLLFYLYLRKGSL